MFNDLIGKVLFDEIEYIIWRKYEIVLKVCLKEVKFLILIRKYILNDDKVRGILKDGLNIVDISDD